ncbi:DoxX family protein [Sphingomonas oligophenolica]|uniref:DoxX family protein n=1 Tax=Sphingomonas oligophenolica TaxID=301154 RepID=A0ABU9YCM8_9SPHN
MTNNAPIGRVSARSRWIGCILTGVVVLFLLMDAGMKMLGLPPAIDATTQLGWPAPSVVLLGVILFACTALYALPRTAVLGAILLTAYLGGAVAAQARVGNPLFSHILFGLYVGIAIWSALYLRIPELRELLHPLRRDLAAEPSP